MGSWAMARRMGWTVGGGLIVAAGALLLATCGSSSSSEQSDDGTCRLDAECGVGYVCRLQRCTCLLCAADGDEETEAPEADLDSAEAESVADEADSEAAETEAEPDSESGDSESYYCDTVTPDPRCLATVNIFCRDNRIDHDIVECKEGNLYLCHSILDCHYPICGSAMTERRLRTCRSGCVVNDDFSQDDYCSEDLASSDSEDGDVDHDSDSEAADGDSVSDSDTPDGDRDAESVESDSESSGETTHTDGSPCTAASDCLPGHYCRADIDDVHKYCASYGACVYHLGLPDSELPYTFYAGQYKCYGAGYRRCSSSGMWYAVTACATASCTGDGQYVPAQTCQSAALPSLSDTDLCQPNPLPSATDCPGHFACSGTTGCYASCTTRVQCQLSYVCKTGVCVLE